MTAILGSDISADDIRDTMGFFDSWEDRYRYVIDLGKQLPEMASALKTDENIVRGCQSQVWLRARNDNGRLHFDVDSDALIVRGLIGILLCAYNGKRPQEILDFDVDAYLAELDLLAHLSPTRGNGLRAMVDRMREVARTNS